MDNYGNGFAAPAAAPAYDLSLSMSNPPAPPAFAPAQFPAPREDALLRYWQCYDVVGDGGNQSYGGEQGYAYGEVAQ